MEPNVPRSGSGSSGTALPHMIRIVFRLVSQHGAGHRQQAIGNGPQGPGMAVAALPQGSVLGLADGVVLRGHARPMIGRLPPDEDARLGGARPGCICRNAGSRERPRTDSARRRNLGAGADRRLPRAGWPGRFGRPRAGRRGSPRPGRSLGPRGRLAPLLPSPDQTVELTRDVPELALHQARRAPEAFRCGLQCLVVPGATGMERTRKRRRTSGASMRRIRWCFNTLATRLGAQLPGRIRCRGQLPHSITQGSARSLLRCRNCGPAPVAPELLAQRLRSRVRSRVNCSPRLENSRNWISESIGSAVASDPRRFGSRRPAPGAAAVILGARRREAVAERSRLPSGIDGIHDKAPPHQELHHRTVRHFYRRTETASALGSPSAAGSSRPSGPGPNRCAGSCAVPDRCLRSSRTHTWCAWDAQSTPTNH